MFSSNKFWLSFFAILILLSFSSLFAADETLTITTYYPSPYGSYNNLTVANRLGVGTTAPVSTLHVFAADNTIAQTVTINAANASITTADTFVSFNSSGGQIGSIAGTATSGTIAYNTFTGSHYTQIDERDGLEPNILLEATGERLNSNQAHLVKSRISSKRRSPAAYGVYGGTNKEGKDFVLSLGAGYIWVANKGKNIKVGDYLMSSDVKGFTEKQDDDIYHNYTVAKAMEPVNWKAKEKKRLIACIYLGG